jgi:hypothetical protein
MMLTFLQSCQLNCEDDLRVFRAHEQVNHGIEAQCVSVSHWFARAIYGLVGSLVWGTVFPDKHWQPEQVTPGVDQGLYP